MGQAWWGKLFCAGGGFSFTALRWSTLVLWLFAALATTLSALRLRARPFTAALAGALIIANPIAMNLGYTFMTDVPFMAVVMSASRTATAGARVKRKAVCDPVAACPLPPARQLWADRSGNEHPCA